MSDNPSPKIHVLVEPRVVAATALLLGGGGIGIGMMAAHLLISLGLLLAFLSCGAATWIYFDHYVKAYKLLSRNETYSGAPLKELLIVAAMTVVIGITAVIVFFAVFFEKEPDRPHARMEFSRVTLAKLNGKSGYYPQIQFINSGPIPASYLSMFGGVYLIDGADDINMPIAIAHMEAARTKLNESGRMAAAGIEMPPNYLAGLSEVHSISDAEIADIGTGKKAMFVWTLVAFGDDNTDSDHYWISAVCMKLDNTLAGGMPCRGYNSVTYERQPSVLRP